MDKISIEFNVDEMDLLSDLVRNEREIALMDSDKDYIQLMNWILVKLEVKKRMLEGD
tara:strand:- start:258 stop:428 length:171 start_codon:yes stop_codon:yes gene_type:complete